MLEALGRARGSAMLKPILITACVAASLVHGAAHAGEGEGSEASTVGMSSVLQFEVRDDLAQARANGTWPSRDYELGEVHCRQAVRRARRQYPNVMGVRLADWLAAHQAARGAQETASLETLGQTN